MYKKGKFMKKSSTKKTAPFVVPPRPSLTQSLEKRVPPKTKLENVAQVLFEPKTANRFMVHMINEKKKHLVEPHLIKYIDRPGFTTVNGEKQWNPIKMRIYEPVVPQHMLFRCIGAGVFDIQVNELGPVGDVVSTWYMPQCRFQEVKSGPLDWGSNGDILEIQCEIDWTEIIVKNGDSEYKIKRKK
jgi:hypothetical protein